MVVANIICILIMSTKKYPCRISKFALEQREREREKASKIEKKVRAKV